MTRKHYRTLAEDLGRGLSLLEDDQQREGYRRAIENLIPTLYDDNPRFSRDTFTEAIHHAEMNIRARRMAADAERKARQEVTQ